MTAIACRNLTHAYSDGRAALRGLTFDLAAGESTAIVGPNGAGKTTLLLRLAGLLPGPRDQAKVNGLDPADPAARRRLPAAVGIAFQNPDDQLFSATLADDVCFGPRNLGLGEADVQARMAAALAAVGLSGAEERVPHHFSGGEKRRAALATILAMQPGILLLDEPTMFLDPRGRRELIGILNGLGGTKLIATHDLDFVLECCPRALVLDDGALLADGPSRSILANEQLLAPHGLEVPWRLRYENGATREQPR